MKKRSLAIATLVATMAPLVFVTTTAYAGQNANASISVAPSVVGPGGTVHIAGSVSSQACPASDAVTVTGDSALFPPDGFGPAVQRDAASNFAVDYTVSTSTPTRRYKIGLRCGGGNPGVFAVLTVSRPSGAAQPGAGGTERGGAVLWTAAAVAFLLVAGTVFTLRRRSARRAS